MAKNTQPGIMEIPQELRQTIMSEDLSDPVKLLERMYQLSWHWADFHLYITSPHIDPIAPPLVIKPAKLSGGEMEYVYHILDYGNQLSTSKAQDMYSAGMSMCKMYYTIEKIIALLIERLKTGGVSPETEVQIAFAGFELAKRKAFESVINLSYNVVVTNFDPSSWGEAYLRNVKTMADKGYGYPSEAPRDRYKQIHGPSPTVRR